MKISMRDSPEGRASVEYFPKLFHPRVFFHSTSHKTRVLQNTHGEMLLQTDRLMEQTLYNNYCQNMCSSWAKSVSNPPPLYRILSWPDVFPPAHAVAFTEHLEETCLHMIPCCVGNVNGTHTFLCRKFHDSLSHIFFPPQTL